MPTALTRYQMRVLQWWYSVRARWRRILGKQDALHQAGSVALLTAAQTEAIQQLIRNSSFSGAVDMLLTALTHLARFFDPELGEVVELITIAIRVAKIVLFTT